MNILWVERQGWFLAHCQKCCGATKHLIGGDLAECYYVTCDGCGDSKFVFKHDIAKLAEKEAR